MSESENSSEDEGQSIQFVPANLRKRSVIHNYFFFNQKSKTSVCKTCKAELAGKNSSNLINHIKKAIHLKDLYPKYLQDVSDNQEATASKKTKLSKEKKKPDLKQQTLHQVYIIQHDKFVVFYISSISSAAAEREFSASGWHTLGRKNRTTGVTLAAKVFLTCNKDLLRPLFF
jgi:hypothetical protein